MAASGSTSVHRYAWYGGVLYVVALLAEAFISVGFKVSQDDSAAKIATSMADHHRRLILVFCLCILYVVGFVIYLTALDSALKQARRDRQFWFGSWVLIGGVLFVTLHGVSDVGIYGLLAGKVASYSAQNAHGLSYTLYLLTFALDSVGDVFGSFFMLGSGLIVLATGTLPRWVGWIGIAASPFLLLQAFGLGGVVSNIGLALDLIGFLLLVIFIAVSSVIALIRGPAGVSLRGCPTSCVSGSGQSVSEVDLERK